MQREPGLHLRALPARLGLSLRSVRYHLTVLENQGLAIPYQNGRRVHWYPSSGIGPEDRILVSAIRVRSQQRLLKVLARRGPTRFSELERESGLSPRSVSRHLHLLIHAGLILAQRDRTYILADPDRVAEQIQTLRARFPDLLADAAREIFDRS